MDALTLIIGIIMLMFFVQYGQTWLVFGALAVFILSMRSLKATIFLVGSVVLFYFFIADIKTLWPIILFGLIIAALIFGVAGKEQQPEMYAPDLGGLGGYGGMGGGY